MELGIKDRIVANALLPAEGDIRTLKTIMKLREAILFNEDEVKEFAITQDGGRVQWDTTKERKVEIEIGELGKEIICNRLQELDSQKKLTADHVAIWDMFVPEK